jgi:hypothetical protein
LKGKEKSQKRGKKKKEGTVPRWLVELAKVPTLRIFGGRAGL